MVVTDFLNLFRGCTHSRVSVNSRGAYCPDCGKFVVVKWYIVRCACCGIKRVAYVDYNDNIRTQDKYCPNCGTMETVVEELDRINFIDINFAVHKKEVEENHIYVQNRTQIWTDTEDNSPQLLLENKCVK